jgi:uroporphyrinogen decarboxylase
MAQRQGPLIPATVFHALRVRTPALRSNPCFIRVYPWLNTIFWSGFFYSVWAKWATIVVVLMNGYERIQAALAGRPADCTPVMLHNFMLAARERGVTMRQFREDARVVADCFAAAVERYQYDGVVVDVDTATLAGAAGAPVDFPADEPARCCGARLSNLELVNELPPLDLAKDRRAQVWLAATHLLKERFRGEVFIRGNCDQAPFSLACLMRGPEGWMLDLLDPRKEPLIHRLLGYCAEAVKQFVRLMAEAGADMTSNGDSLASPDLIAPAMYRRFALPYESQVITRAHELGLPHALHICGNTTRIVSDMVASGADALELDYKTDVRAAHDALKGRAAFIGNLDPAGVLLNGSPQLVAEKTRALMQVFADTPGFILNAGCAIPPGTPAENIRAMIRVARSERD